MTLLQKIALLLAVVALIMSALALIQGEFRDAALGVFVSAVALATNFRNWPTKPLWRHRKS
jgi:hypothetical protein